MNKKTVLTQPFLVLATFWSLFGCEFGEDRQDKIEKYDTFYGSGNIRTTFKHKNGLIWDTLTLYDSLGAIELQGIYSQVNGVESFQELSKKSEDTLIFSEERNSETVIQTVDSNFYKIGDLYKIRSARDKFTGFARFLFWINSSGTLAHAVCLENTTSRPLFILDVVNEFESWKFQEEGKARLLVAKQKVKFVP
jgi:hypothetical protein